MTAVNSGCDPAHTSPFFAASVRSAAVMPRLYVGSFLFLIASVWCGVQGADQRALGCLWSPPVWPL
ncbi:MAG: hypothetical protein CMN97_06190 [Synechococcus sp. NAT40]|nr:hypothetical protein [Synechococcus sp. NAT40]